ncbi:MAG: hypothetical protein ABR544_05870 [Gammaproteobacteria bacterium]
MSIKGHCMHHWLAACLLLPLSGLSSVQAETADERLQRLESELQELRQMLHEQQQERREAAPAAVVPRSPQAAPAVAAPVAQPGVHIRYYIQNEPLDSSSPAAARPLVEGRITEADTLSFDPSAYDVPGAGLMSPYRDPASYRYVGLLLEGRLPITYPGEYELVIYPQPAREGGSTVSVRMSIQASLGDVRVVDYQDEAGRSARRGQVHLEAGLHPLRIWALAISDGFGPSPTSSGMRLALKGPRDASPRPLRELLMPASLD